jgi:hypothetical protein
MEKKRDDNLIAHEKIILQMCKEIKAKGQFISGGRRHIEWMLTEKMMQRTQVSEPGTNITKLRYRLTPQGEGLFDYLTEKYKGDIEISQAR